MKKYILHMLLVKILLLQACIFFDKDQPKPADVLPPYTQQGANTIGCLVDGRVLVPGFSMADKYFGWSSVDNDFTFYIDRDGERVEIGVWDGTVTDTGYYDLKYIRNKREVSYYHPVTAGGESVEGKLHIKYWDKQKHIMAGTFHFDAMKGDSSIIKITKGRFDMIYN